MCRQGKFDVKLGCLLTNQKICLDSYCESASWHSLLKEVPFRVSPGTVETLRRFIDSSSVNMKPVFLFISTDGNGSC